MVAPNATVFDTVFWGLTTGVLRGLIGTPFDAWAILAISKFDSSGLRSLRELFSAGSYFRGFFPNTVRTSIRSPVHYVSLEAGSAAYTSVVPQVFRDRFPVLRGFCIGVTAALAESVVNTPLRVIQTLAVNGDPLGTALRAEGVKLLTRGFDGTLIHRLLSGAVFYGVYEQSISMGVSIAPAALLAGTMQVSLSSPFFALAVHKQKLAGRVAGNIFSLAATLGRERGVIQGLFLPGLAPRLLHSWIASPLVMWVIDVKLHAIRRD
jgi:hypothetical protein